MRKRASLMVAAGVAGLLTAGWSTFAAAADEVTGKQLAYDNKKGNCLACHAMPTAADAVSPGTIAPPLVSMKARYPDKAVLRAQIWDATKANPNTSMPPFGKHKILTEQEVDKVTDFIYGL